MDKCPKREKVRPDPAVWEEKVRQAIRDAEWDQEAAHADTDELMEDLLIELGYGAGVELIRSLERWYA